MIRTCAALACCLLMLPTGVAGAWPAPKPGAGPKTLVDVGSQCEDLAAEPITYGTLYEIPGSGLPGGAIDMHDVWLAGGCVGCHNVTAMGQLRLDQPENAGYELVSALSYRNPQILLVEPGQPENSLLYTMLNCMPFESYPVMPPALDGASQRIARPLRALVYDWIQQGARGFDEDGTPYSDILFRDQAEGTRLQRLLTTPPPMATR
ncbi:MAG: hypothetical protein ACK55W_17880 [Pseudomonadota bacterium]